MFKYISLIFLVSCASTTPSDINQIKHDYRKFVHDCEYLGGEASIDRPFNKRRVQNAPVTPWEMQDAICTYPGERPVRMYY